MEILFIVGAIILLRVIITAWYKQYYYNKHKPTYIIDWDIEEKEKGLAYLEALYECNIIAPTDDIEEKRLAQYLERRRNKEKANNDIYTIVGSFNTLYAPGLSALRYAQDSSGLQNMTQQQQAERLYGIDKLNYSNKC